jgi:hypothetical protein
MRDQTASIRRRERPAYVVFVDYHEGAWRAEIPAVSCVIADCPSTHAAEDAARQCLAEKLRIPPLSFDLRVVVSYPPTPVAD